jgi:hypothetical protein
MLAFLELYLNHIRKELRRRTDSPYRFPTLLGREGSSLEADGVVDLFELLLEVEGVLVETDEVGVEGHAVPAVVVRAAHAAPLLRQDLLQSQLWLILHYLQPPCKMDLI